MIEEDSEMHNIECYNTKCSQHMHDEDCIAYCDGKCPEEETDNPVVVLHKCYYCGNDLNYAYTDDEIMDHQYDSASFDPIFRVGCPLCGMLGPRAWNEKEAKELWNNIKIQ